MVTTTTTTRSKVKVKSYCANFILFWNSYPNKKAKAKAAKSYEKAISAGASHDHLIEAVEKAKRMNTNWRDPQYIPMAATWLNGRRWEDEFSDTDNEVNTSPGGQITPGAAAGLRVLDSIRREKAVGGSSEGPDGV
tara:strand:+ start:176 stop:583 length:408 start_codon:yes stop_codon:yes gene_type:complete